MNDDDVDSLAAEYVLGTLDSEERTRAQVLLDVDHGFRGVVRIWERRLGELHLMVEPIEPAPQIWDRIRAKMPAVLPSQDMVLSELPKSPETGLPQVEPPTEQRWPEAIEKAPPTPEPRPGEAVRASAESTSALARIASRLEDPDVIARRRESVRPPPVQDRPRGGGAWRVLGLLMMVLVVVLGGLIAAWRFIPERLPPQLRATTILHIQIPTGPVRRPPPPGSEFDE